MQGWQLPGSVRAGEVQGMPKGLSVPRSADDLALYLRDRELQRQGVPNRLYEVPSGDILKQYRLGLDYLLHGLQAEVLLPRSGSQHHQESHQVPRGSVLPRKNDQ